MSGSLGGREVEMMVMGEGRWVVRERERERDSWCVCLLHIQHTCYEKGFKNVKFLIACLEKNGSFFPCYWSVVCHG